MVQNRKVDIEFMPMFTLSYFKYDNGLKNYQAYDKDVDSFNRRTKTSMPILLACNPKTLDNQQSEKFLKLVDKLTTQIQNTRDMQTAKPLLLQRAVAYTVVQNYDDAIADLNTYIKIDSTSSIAYWQRAVCQTMLNNFKTSQGIEAGLKAARSMADFDNALKLSPGNQYLYYDRGNLHAQRKEYAQAIDDYSQAIKIDTNLAEAHYNKGLALIYTNRISEGIEELSKAGELGLVDAYSAIKKFSNK